MMKKIKDWGSGYVEFYGRAGNLPELIGLAAGASQALDRNHADRQFVRIYPDGAVGQGYELGNGSANASEYYDKSPHCLTIAEEYDEEFADEFVEEIQQWATEKFEE